MSPIERVEDVRSIAVLRANSIGDFVFAFPALVALRAAYPHAEIVLLARAWHAEFLRERPGPIDRVVVLPPIGGITVPPGNGEKTVPEAFLRAMRAERFDLAIQLHGGGAASNPFVVALGARVTAGMRARGVAPLDRWVRYIYFQHEVLRYLEVVGLVGATPVDLEPQLAILPRDRAEAAAVVPGAEPYAIVHPGATDARRRWSPDLYASVGMRLTQAGLRVIVTGDANEAALAQEVAGAIGVGALAVGGRLSLGGLASLMNGAALVVGNDTGPLHLARLVGPPTVTLYWVGNLINGAPMSRHRHRALTSWQLDCPVCGVANVDVRCPHDPSFLDRIALQDVEDEIFDVLACTAPERTAQRDATSSPKSASQS